MLTVNPDLVTTFLSCWKENLPVYQTSRYKTLAEQQNSQTSESKYKACFSLALMQTSFVSFLGCRKGVIVYSQC